MAAKHIRFSFSIEQFETFHYLICEACSTEPNDKYDYSTFDCPDLDSALAKIKMYSKRSEKELFGPVK